MRNIRGRQRKPRESLFGKITFSGTGETPVVQLSDKMNQPPPTLEYSTQPPGSLIVCEERPDGLSIFIPFPGVWQGGKQGFWTVCQSVVIYLFLLYMLWIMHTWFLGTNLPRVIFFPLFLPQSSFLIISLLRQSFHSEWHGYSDRICSSNLMLINSFSGSNRDFRSANLNGPERKSAVYARIGSV